MQERARASGRFGLGDRARARARLSCWRPPPSAAKKHTKQVKDTTVWLCKPGIPDNPCEPGFDTTLLVAVRPDGRHPVRQADEKRKFDCFYVYPTVSDDKTPNSDLSIDPEERSIALYQAARYSLHCRVFAPMYRQLTLGAILNGAPIPPDARQIAYGDVAGRLEDLPAQVQPGPRRRPHRPLPGHASCCASSFTSSSTRTRRCAPG